MKAGVHQGARFLLSQAINDFPIGTLSSDDRFPEEGMDLCNSLSSFILHPSSLLHYRSHLHDFKIRPLDRFQSA
jgi:hypothetical protein